MPAPASSLAVVVLALGLASSEQPPVLPSLPLEKLPPALRERAGEAQARAQREPGSASASGAVAMLLHAHDQFELAEAWYARAHALDAASGDWAYLLGVTQAERGRQEEAVRSLRESLAARPSYVPARLKLGELLLARGQVEAAAPVYESLLKEQPELPHVHHGLARVEAARGRAAAAVEREERAIELFPAYGAAHYSLGLFYRDLGQLDQARAALALSEAHRLSGPALDDSLLRSVRQLKTGPRALLAEGARLGKSGDLEAAVRAHEQALQADPKLVQAHANLISLFGRLGRWDKAEEHYRAAAALNPGLAEIHYDYGVLLVQQNRPREAADAFRRALASNPFYAQAHNNLGNMLESEGKLAQAETHYRAAIENDPGYRLARFNLGRMLVAKRLLPEAIAELEKTLAPEDQDTPRYMYALAAAWVRAGDREKGLRYGREAQQRAEALGQAELAATIARDLRNLLPRP